MSYILDALRKADAQRESNPARGIHAQASSLPSGAQRLRSPLSLWVWLACAVGVAVLAWGFASIYSQRDRPVAAVAPAAMPPVAVVQAPAAPAPMVVPAGPQAAPGIVPAAPMMPLAHEPRASAQVIAAGPPAAAIAVPSPEAAGPGRPVPAPAPAPATAPVPAPTLATGLPPDAPKLAISGGVYSANVAARMLIVNGQVFNEGSEIGPGVVLDQVKPKSAVLKFRGTLYSVPY